jgi:purine-nucleoside phosphorylase
MVSSWCSNRQEDVMTGPGELTGPFERARVGASVLARDVDVASMGGAVDVVMICGSGWADALAQLDDQRTVSAGERYLMPVPSVGGHVGDVVLGRAGGTRVLAFLGRVHLYEGHSAADVAHPVRMAHALGAQILVTSNAGGAIRDFEVGQVVGICDHVNLTGANPLEGPLDSDVSRFVDLVDAYDPALLDVVRRVRPGIDTGVYAALRGPSYETVGEIDYLDRAGVDLVGMSTVCETIAGRHVGMRVVGLTLVSNRAAGRGTGGLDHAEVTAVGRDVAGTTSEFTVDVLTALGGECVQDLDT